MPKPEAQRVDSGGGVLGDGEASLLPTSYRFWMSAVSSPSAAKRFLAF